MRTFSLVCADVSDNLNGLNYNGWLFSKKQRGKIECLFQLHMNYAAVNGKLCTPIPTDAGGHGGGALDQGCLLNEANSLLFGSISCIQTSFLSLPRVFFKKSLKGVVVVVGEGGVGVDTPMNAGRNAYN